MKALLGHEKAVCRSVCDGVLERCSLGHSTGATARSEIAANCIQVQTGTRLTCRIDLACQLQVTSSTVLHTLGSELQNLEFVGVSTRLRQVREWRGSRHMACPAVQHRDTVNIILNWFSRQACWRSW